MSWPMPPTGQWSSGMNMTDNMGSYTPEQWALMQQQNWQQWAQWQQQYSQWQNQYGDKYVQQMQAYQGVGAVPPPPTNPAPPPAPPPPDKPPPPPPHENDQPLYGKTVTNVPLMSLPVQPSVKPPQNNSQAGYSNAADKAKNQSWSYTADSQSEKQSVNTEALKKLAEEERLFDIQFKKWEDEIQKWKAENVNHPDKQAYNEYEQKFEACRAQLMERRNQMKQKRALLTGNQSQVTNTTNTGNQQAAPLLQNTKYSQNVQSNTTQKDTPANYTNAIGLQRPPPQVQYNMNQHPNYNRTNNKIIDVQDGHDSYQNMEENYKSNQQSVNSDFLRTNQLKGIPGLDLVPDSGPVPNKKQEVVEIIEQDQTMQQQQMPQAPDYLNISRGINNILGDEKIMNILSQMSNQKPGNNDQQKANSHNKQDVQQWGRNNSNYYNNNNYNNQQNMPYKHQNVTNYSNTHEQMTNSNYSNPHNNYPQNRGYRQNNIPQEQYYDEQSPYDNTIPPRPKMIPQSLMPNMAKQPLIPNPNSPNSPTMELQNTMYSQSQSGFQNRPHMENPIIQPIKPKWIDEPLFTPSIIVDYEHKPLRLKARDFIEPVHLFDYHHKSKDGEDNFKKNFEREVDELFTRKSRRKDEDWNADRHYERRPLRDDARDHSKFVSREGNDFYNRRGYDRYENRRRDDRDRLGRDDRDRDDDRRDRVNDYDRLRDRDYGRDREFLPLRDRDPLPVRDRDTGRDRDPGRDRDSGRDRDIGRDRDSGRDRDFDRGRDLGKDRDTFRDKEPGYNFGRDRIGGRDRDSRDKERYRDRREDIRNHSRSREQDSRKRAHSKDTDSIESFNSKKSKEVKEDISSSKPSKPQHVVMIDDLLEPPGRDMRPEKIIIILRGAPGSGKSYLAKLIRDKEAEYNGTVRIMSIDDYFMQESEVEEKDPTTGKIVKKQSLKYEYDETLEETYMNSLRRAFKRTITDGYFTFLIFDAINDQLKGYADVWNFGRQNGFQVYICTMEMDVQTCFKRNIHNRKLEEIEVIVSRFFPTPLHHIQLDATTLLQSASITDVQMEDIDDVTMEDAENTEVESSFTSKWEKMDDAAQLARLDGTSKPLRSSQLSMEDYLQLDEWTPNKAKPGKKTVRWADIEERREQEKMRAIGFVVGQTDWNRMTDPTMGSSALTQTKYIERVRKY